MKILFIAKDLEFQEPVGIMYLSALLKEKGHNVYLTGTRNTDVLKYVKETEPDILAYSVTTGLHKYYLALNKKIRKEYKAFSLFGGPHPTFFPEMIEEEFVDSICIGEGEEATVELVEGLKNKTDITNIKNLWLKVNGKIYQNSLRPLITDLDKIPFPDRELQYKTDESFRKHPVKSFISGRGCPYECTYCFNRSFIDIYGPAWKKVRVRTVDNLIDEICSVKEMANLKFVQFRDSIFAIKRNWLKEFAEKYPERVGLPFNCHLRANLVNEDMVLLLKKAGCHSISMGIESGNDFLRNEVLERNMSREEILNACKILKKHNIKILSENILGLPGGSLKTDLETLKINIEAEVDYPVATIMQPYPGTIISKYSIENDYFDGNFDKISYNYYANSVMKFKDGEEKKQIENFQRLFAVTCELPWLLPLVKILLKLPKNLIYTSIFRTWCIYCYQARIVPYPMSFYDWKQKTKAIFGIYEKDYKV